MNKECIQSFVRMLTPQQKLKYKDRINTLLDRFDMDNLKPTSVIKPTGRYDFKPRPPKPIDNFKQEFDTVKVEEQEQSEEAEKHFLLNSNRFYSIVKLVRQKEIDVVINQAGVYEEITILLKHLKNATPNLIITTVHHNCIEFGGISSLLFGDSSLLLEGIVLYFLFDL